MEVNMSTKEIVRKSILVLIFSLFVFILSSCISYEWIAVVESNPDQSISLAGFLNKSLGITVGCDGIIYYTENGSEDWNEADNASFHNLFGLEILNEEVAFYCGDAGHVGISVDEGKTWQRVTDFGILELNHCRFLSFINPDTGWIASPDLLGATYDGGKSWQEVTLPDGISKILAIDLYAQDKGVILNDKGELYFTQDNGSTWQKKILNIDVENYYFQTDICPTIGMRFSDSQTGMIVVCQQKPEKSWVSLVITDGSVTEKVLVTTTDDMSIFSSVFLSRDTKYLTLTDTTKKVVVYRMER
jgi:hypothetical protein